jgi:hypothetical protein
MMILSSKFSSVSCTLVLSFSPPWQDKKILLKLGLNLCLYCPILLYEFYMKDNINAKMVVSTGIFVLHVDKGLLRTYTFRFLTFQLYILH